MNALGNGRHALDGYRDDLPVKLQKVSGGRTTLHGRLRSTIYITDTSTSPSMKMTAWSVVYRACMATLAGLMMVKACT